jgi:hypothetical protein
VGLAEMPNNEVPGDKTKSLAWIKESGLLAVTLTGLTLYFFLSIPATLFYSQLGTTPGEVGINYVNLLSSSTFELLVIFVVLALAVLVGGFFLAYFLMLAYQAMPSLYSIWRVRKQTDQERATRGFDFNLKLYRRIPEFLQTRITFWPDFPKTLGELEALMKRRLELQVPDATQEQSAELESINSQLSFPREARRRKDFIRTFVVLFLIIRHRIRPLAVSFALTIVVIILPVLAFIQAGQIRDGHTFFASDTGIFDYSADPVSIYPVASNSAAAVISNLRKEELFLLGENSVNAVLYAPADHATIRVPISAVILVSVRN